MFSTVEAKKTDRVRAFTHLTERFCQLLQREGMTVQPYRGDRPACFMALPDERQEQVLKGFENYVAICVETIAGGWSLRDDAQMLWRMFKSMRVRPTSELMASIEQGDVIEIYDANYTQVFRNLAFFSICSYTLDDLLARPFWELFRREEAVNGELMKVGTEIFGGKVGGVYHWGMAPHTVNEVESPAMYETNIQEKIASPLQDASGQVAAIVTTCRILSSVSKNTSVESIPRIANNHGFKPVVEGTGANESD